MTNSNAKLEQASAHELWNFRYLMLMLANFFTSLVHFCFLTLLPMYALRIGGNNTQAGLMTGLYSFAALFCRPLFGKMLDKLGRKPVLIIGLTLITLSSAAYIFTHSMLVFLFFRIINGIGFSAGSTAIATVVADILPEKRLAEGIGYFGLSNTFGQAVGPFLGLWIIQNFGFPVFFICAVGVSVLSLSGTLTLKYEEKNDSNIEKRYLTKPEKQEHGMLEAQLVWPILILLLAATSNGSVMTFVTNYALSLGIDNIGSFFTVVSIGTILSRLVFGKLSNHLKLGSILVLALIGILLSQFVLGFATKLWLFLIAAIFFGLGIGWTVPVINTIIVLFASAERKGSALAGFYCALDIGVGGSAIIWGVIAQHFGYPPIYFLAALNCGCALVLYYAALKKRLKAI
ncbi:MAG: MFS transporter [Peptococcaceae bacterium]|nr:MFS transporter [Peptococcaceae bacterium]